MLSKEDQRGMTSDEIESDDDDRVGTGAGAEEEGISGG